MAALQNALNQAHGLKVKNNPVIKNAMNQINNQKQIIVKNMNKTIRTLNKTGLKQKKMVQSLNLTTKNIAPLTRQADGIKISILKSMQLKQSPVVISQVIKDQKSEKVPKQTDGQSGFIAPKMTIIPVPLEKPLAALHQAAGSINNASITKPERPEEEGINDAKAEMDLEPKTTQKPKAIEPPKKPSTIDIAPTQVSETQELTKAQKEEVEVFKLDMTKEPTNSKPMKIKDLIFTKTMKGKETSLGALPLQLPIPHKTIEYEAEEINKKTESTQKTLKLDKEKQIEQPKPTIKAITPIASAIALLAGSTATAAATTVKIAPKIVETPVKSMNIQELDTKITPPPEIGSTETYQEITKTEFEKEIETEPKLRPIEKEPSEQQKIDVLQETGAPSKPEIEGFVGKSMIPQKTKSAESVVRTSATIARARAIQKKTTSWIPITAAIGLVGSLASSAVITNIQAQKVRILPKPSILPKTTVGTQEVTPLDSVRKEKLKIVTPKLTKPVRVTSEEEPVLEKKTVSVEKTEMGEKVQRRTKTEPQPIPLMIPAAGAIGLLTFAAKKTTPEENLILKAHSIAPGRISSDLEVTPRIISKRTMIKESNIPKLTDSAINDLSTAAKKAKKSLYMDQVKAVKTSTSKSTSTTIADLQKSIKPSHIRSEVTSEIGAQEIERKLMIDTESIGALNVLNTAAITTAITKADIISRSPLITTKGHTDNFYKIQPPIGSPHADTSIFSPKLPVLKPKAISPTTSEIDTQLNRQDRIKESAIVRPSTTKRAQKGTIARTGPSAIPISRYKQPTKRLAVQSPRQSVAKSKGEDALNFLNVIAASAVRPKRIVTPEAQKQFKNATSLVTQPAQKMGRPVPLTGIPSISKALSLIRRPETRLAEQMGLEMARGYSEAGIEPGPTQQAVIGSKIQEKTQQLAAKQRPQVGAYNQIDRRPVLLARQMARQTKKQPELYHGGGPKSIDFDQIPTGAPVKRDVHGEQISNLEDQIEYLREQLKADSKDDKFSNRKLQEFVHDPNLQTQLKKLFYESWLENMDKELKRYGE